jgi:hypothetical protein
MPATDDRRQPGEGDLRMLKLRSIGLSDYSVLEGNQRIGRIRLATERMPCRWLWNVIIHLPGGLPMGSARDLDTAKADFRVAWEALKARTTPEQLLAAYRDLNIAGLPSVTRSLPRERRITLRQSASC